MRSHLKTIASITVVLASVTSVAAAQKGHRFGIQAGVDFAKVTGKGVDQFVVKNRTGFLAGVFAELQANKNVAISPELDYVVKGVKQSETNTTIKAKVPFVQIPVLLKVLIPVKSSGKAEIRPQFYVGPAIGFRTGCNLSLADGTTTVSGKCGVSPFQDVKIKSTEFSILFGASLGVGPVFFGVRYDLGLTDIQNAPGHTSADVVKTRALSLLAGVSFPIRKK